MSAFELIASLGQYSFWGASAAFDCVDAYTNAMKDEVDLSNTTPLRVLLVNVSDIRHIIATLSHQYRQSRPVEFYLLDSPTEVLARNILLLEILHDFDVPIRQRANNFLEVFGNSKVQERTSKYVELLGQQLRNLVATGKGKLEHFIDLSLLKYKEKDVLEECFKSYSTSSYPFDIDHYRDYRMRGFYGERYDSRVALADWDYHESIRIRASIIHIRQFKDWRNTGIAFEFGDQYYTDPNRTLMAYAEGYVKQGKDKGMKKEVKGYWGDIVNSPYFSFGIDCDTKNGPSKGLFEIHNKGTGSEQHRHHTVEIAVFNILSYLYQLETHEEYTMKIDHDIFSGLGKDMMKMSKDDIIHEKATIEELPEEESLNDSSNDEEAVLIARAENIIKSFDKFKIFPVVGTVKEKLNKPRFEKYFDVIMVSARSAQILNDDDIVKIMADKAIIAVETAKFIGPLPKPIQKQQFIEKVQQYASKKGLKHIKAPIPRRKRDELDMEEDVIFFKS